MSDIMIFEADAHQVKVRLEGETLWITQAQMAELFDVQKAAVSKHLKNIYASGELEQEATVSKMETVREEGRRTVTVASMKGETHLASLVLESHGGQSKRFDLGCALPILCGAEQMNPKASALLKSQYRNPQGAASRLRDALANDLWGRVPVSTAGPTGEWRSAGQAVARDRTDPGSVSGK